MSCCRQVLSEEFRWKRFGFSGIRVERFCTSQWRMPAFVYLTYRFLLMAYTVFWLGYTSYFGSRAPQAHGAYLTNWTYTLLTIYLICHFVAALIFHVQKILRSGPSSVSPSCCARPSVEHHQSIFVEIVSTVQGESQYEYTLGAGNTTQLEGGALRRTPWYMCIVWILFSAVSSGGVMVTMVFFTFLYPNLKQGNSGIGLENLQLHVLNSVIIILEHIITGVPHRLLHVVYPFLYGLIYMIFSVIYWAMDHSHVMYPILNWSKPGPTIGYAFMVGFVLIPIFHLCFFVIYKVKVAIFRCL